MALVYKLSIVGSLAPYNVSGKIDITYPICTIVIPTFQSINYAINKKPIKNIIPSFMPNQLYGCPKVDTVLT